MTGTHLGNSRELIQDEIRRAVTREARHAPTIAYKIRNAVLFDGSVYAKNHKIRLIDSGRHSSGIAQLGEAALVSTQVGCTHFAHWLLDDCLQYQLASDLQLEPLSVPLNYRDLSGYAELLEQPKVSSHRAWIAELTVFQDFSQNSLKRKRYEVLRTRLANKFPPPQSRNDLIYLKRGKTGAARIVENEDEIESALLKQGFTIIDIASASLHEVLRSLLGARLVISMEGSHLAHCILTMQRGSAIITLQPPDRLVSLFRGYCECLGVRFGFTIGTKGETGSRFDMNELQTLISLIAGS